MEVGPRNGGGTDVSGNTNCDGLYTGAVRGGGGGGGMLKGGGTDTLATSGGGSEQCGGGGGGGGGGAAAICGVSGGGIGGGAKLDEVTSIKGACGLIDDESRPAAVYDTAAAYDDAGSERDGAPGRAVVAAGCSLAQSQRPSLSGAPPTEEACCCSEVTEMSRVPSPSLLYTVLSSGGRGGSSVLEVPLRGVARSTSSASSSTGLPGSGLVDRLRRLNGLSTLLMGLCGGSSSRRARCEGGVGDSGVRGVTGRSGEADGVRGGVSGGVRGPRLLGSGDRPAVVSPPPFLEEEEQGEGAGGLRCLLRAVGEGGPAFTALILMDRLSSCVPLSPPRSFR